MNISKDRRSAKRIPYICEVQCEGSGLARLSTRINDLSAEGIFIDSMTCYGVGTILKLRFYVRDVLIEVTGEVRYGMPQIGMGIHFLDLKPEDRTTIESFIEGKPMPKQPSNPTTGSLQEEAPSAPQTQKVLTGNFALVSLFDVIQIIENSRLTGALLIVSPSVTGEIHFNEGLIVGGESGPDTGLKAINKFLGATEGIFEFKKSGRAYERAIQATSNTGLLLDLLHSEDEKESSFPSF
ncbi:MAG: DUF4388 domain-containing protein [Blastocatellia bacterium]|nr:DUF4388 domain-containing protein [Blastocatellia bacterium]